MKLYDCWNVVVAAPNECAAKMYARSFLREMMGESEARGHVEGSEPSSEITEPMRWHQHVKGEGVDDELAPEQIIALDEGAGVRGTQDDLYEGC